MGAALRRCTQMNTSRLVSGGSRPGVRRRRERSTRWRGVARSSWTRRRTNSSAGHGRSDLLRCTKRAGGRGMCSCRWCTLSPAILRLPSPFTSCLLSLSRPAVACVWRPLGPPRPARCRGAHRPRRRPPAVARTCRPHATCPDLPPDLPVDLPRDLPVDLRRANRARPPADVPSGVRVTAVCPVAARGGDADGHPGGGGTHCLGQPPPSAGRSKRSPSPPPSRASPGQRR